MFWWHRNAIMKIWKIDYWDNDRGKSSIEKWLDKLPKEQLKNVTKVLRILEKMGNELKLPHSRPLGDGLFELRERRFGYRVYYCFEKEQLIILLAAGDKGSQDNDIKVARSRMSRGK